MIGNRSIPVFLSLEAPASRPPDGLIYELFGRGTTKRGGVLLTFILALLFFTISFVHVPIAQAATTFTVNSLLDNTTTDGNCTLREAISKANGVAIADCGADSGGPYTINFSVSGTITLAVDLPFIIRDQTIDGTGQNVVINGSDTYRLLLVASVKLALKNLTLTHGAASTGGAIYNDTDSTLDITGCTFSNNNSSSGGAIYSQSAVTVSNSIFSGNSSGSGGAIKLNDGALVITGSTFSGNSATNYGGALDADGEDVTVDTSSFLNNTSAGTGGAIDHDSGILTITRSTFSGNQANEGGTIWNGYELILGNSTFSGNISATNGGAIAMFANPTTIANCTFAGNSATKVGGAIYTGSGTTPTLANTIIADSPSGGNCGGIGTITDGGNNLQFGGSVANSCGATIPTPVSDPLGSNVLANNGGPTETIALPLGSAAIDAGNDAVCAETPVDGVDQRGIRRPQGLHCDIGAYEFFVPMPDTSTCGSLLANNLYSCSVVCNGSPYGYHDCVQFINPGFVATGHFDMQFADIANNGSSSDPLGCSTDVDDPHRFLCAASTGNTSPSAGFGFSGMVGRSLNFDGNLAKGSFNCRYDCMLDPNCSVSAPR